MPATIDVTISPLKLPLYGVGGIQLLVDGEVAAETAFGHSVSVNVAPGTHQVALKLLGVLNRTSNIVVVELKDDQSTKLVGKYSRLWGSFSLKRV